MCHCSALPFLWALLLLLCTCTVCCLWQGQSTAITFRICLQGLQTRSFGTSGIAVCSSFWARQLTQDTSFLCHRREWSCLQAKPHANGVASSAPAKGVTAGKTAAPQPSALVRAACLDHATGVGIAVSHINEGNPPQRPASDHSHTANQHLPSYFSLQHPAAVQW